MQRPAEARALSEILNALGREIPRPARDVVLSDAARRELDAPVSTFAELLEFLGYDTAEPKPAAVTVDLRVREKFGEWTDGVVRGVRGFKRARRAVVPVTTVAAKFSGKDAGA